jgi:Protoglobin
MNAESGSPDLPAITLVELRTRKAFVGLDAGAVMALRALRPWMEEHAREIVEEFYSHLMRFEEPRQWLTDPQVLARVKPAQTDYLRSLTHGRFDAAFIASRMAIGRTHARVGITPQWYLGAYSIFTRLLLPRILASHRDHPETALTAVKALIAVIHLDMQLAIDAYVGAGQEGLHQRVADLESEVVAQTGELDARVHQLETLYRVSSAASRELDLGKVLASTLPYLAGVVGTCGAEVFLMDLGDHRCHAADRRRYGYRGLCPCPATSSTGHCHDCLRL